MKIYINEFHLTSTVLLNVARLSAKLTIVAVGDEFEGVQEHPETEEE
jgi:hypothetical protein